MTKQPILKNKPMINGLCRLRGSVTERVEDVFRAYMATAYINGQNINDENTIRAMAASAVKMAAKVARVTTEEASAIIARRVDAVLRHGNRSQAVLNWQTA